MVATNKQSGPTIGGFSSFFFVCVVLSQQILVSLIGCIKHKEKSGFSSLYLTLLKVCQGSQPKEASQVSSNSFFCGTIPVPSKQTLAMKDVGPSMSRCIFVGKHVVIFDVY